MAAETLPDIAFMRECLDYNPATGIFIWRERPPGHFARSYEYKRWNARYAGSLAGRGDGRSPQLFCALLSARWVPLKRIASPGRLFMAFLVPDQIDHIDGNTRNNGIQQPADGIELRKQDEHQTERH